MGSAALQTYDLLPGGHECPWDAEDIWVLEIPDESRPPFPPSLAQSLPISHNQV